MYIPEQSGQQIMLPKHYYYMCSTYATTNGCVLKNIIFNRIKEQMFIFKGLEKQDL